MKSFNLDALNKVTEKTAPRTTGISPFMELELVDILPNPNQPRKSFENIEELAESIAAKGLIQPIAVVKQETGYMIVSGERRFRASQLLGTGTIKAHILNADGKTVQELALIENIQRDDLSDFEKAQYIVELWNSGHYAQKQDLAAAIGKPQSYVSKVFSTLNLDDEIIADIKKESLDIPLSVLDELSRVKDPVVQKEVYQQYTAKEITRDDIRTVAQTGSKIPRAKKERTYKTVNVRSFMKKGSEVIDAISTYTFDPDKKYTITIEEV